jgi:hypothetical protein
MGTKGGMGLRSGGRGREGGRKEESLRRDFEREGIKINLVNVTKTKTFIGYHLDRQSPAFVATSHIYTTTSSSNHIISTFFHLNLISQSHLIHH